MKSMKLGLAMLLATAGTAQAGVIWNGHEYELVSAPEISWSAASSAANSSGWYLATVTSAEEHNFILSALLGPLGDVQHRSHYWTGGSDAAAEGSWTWATGESFSYASWWLLEPNNAGGIEHNLAYDYYSGWGWNWNDVPDDISQVYPGLLRGYIQERSVNVPEPGTLGLLGLGLLAAAGVRRRGA